MATTRHGDGISLAKGPAAILGIAMIAYGVLALLFGSSSFTTGTDVTGDTFLGLEGNGWTNLLWIAAGALLVFAAPMHASAKTMAIVVGLVLGAAAVIRLVDGSDVLGVFAANGWTTLAWGAAAIALLAIALLPRIGRGRDRGREDRHAHREDRYAHRTDDRHEGAGDGAGRTRAHAAAERADDPFSEGYRERERELFEEGKRARDRDAERSRGRFEREEDAAAQRDEPHVERERR